MHLISLTGSKEQYKRQRRNTYLILNHRRGLSDHLGMCTCLVQSKIHPHRNVCKLLQIKQIPLKLALKPPKHIKKTQPPDRKYVFSTNHQNTYKLIKLHTTDSKSVPSIHLCLCNRELTPGILVSYDRNISQTALNTQADFLRKGKLWLVWHFPKALPLEEGWLRCSITMLPLFLHHRYSSATIPMRANCISISEKGLISLWELLTVQHTITCEYIYSNMMNICIL